MKKPASSEQLGNITSAMWVSAEDEVERLEAENVQLRTALTDCLTLIDDMGRFVGQMSLRDYRLFNEAPIRARALVE